MRFGLEIQEKGFNIYVSGIPGTGRRTAVRKFLDELAKTKPLSDDLVYVNNFSNQYEPLAIRLPAGMGNQFKAEIASLIDEARRGLPRAFESEDYAIKQQQATDKLTKDREGIIRQVNEKAAELGFVIQMGPTGLLVLPVIDGKQISPEEFETLPEPIRNEILEKREVLNTDLRNGFRLLRDLDSRGTEAVTAVNNEIALYVIGHLVDGMKEKFRDHKEVLSYIDAVRKDILENLTLFLGQDQPQQQQVPPRSSNTLRRILHSENIR